MTNVSPNVTAPTLWNYTVCGQYPGAVGYSATVTLKCACGLPAYRYLIAQFPITDYANVCELEVYIHRKLLYGHGVVICKSTVRLFYPMKQLA